MDPKSSRPWIALVANVWHDPKLYALSAEGMAVWVWILCTSKLDHLNGRVPKEYLSPEFVAASCRMSPESARNSIKKIVETGVVTEQEDGAILINSWEKYQRPPSSHPFSVSERVRRHRGKTKNSKDLGENGDDSEGEMNIRPGVTRCNDLKRDVTSVTTCNELKRDVTSVTTCNELKRDVTTDRTRQDRTGQDNKKEENPISPGEKSPPASGGDDLPAQIFEYWKKTMGKDGRTRLTAERRNKIKARLKRYTPHDIGLAILGCRHSPFNMGDNDNGKQYNDIELICRNDTKLETFRDLGIEAKAVGRTPPQIGGRTPDSGVSPEDAFKRLEQENGQGNE